MAPENDPAVDLFNTLAAVAKDNLAEVVLELARSGNVRTLSKLATTIPSICTNLDPLLGVANFAYSIMPLQSNAQADQKSEALALMKDWIDLCGKADVEAMVKHIRPSIPIDVLSPLVVMGGAELDSNGALSRAIREMVVESEKPAFVNFAVAESARIGSFGPYASAIAGALEADPSWYTRNMMESMRNLPIPDDHLQAMGSATASTILEATSTLRGLLTFERHKLIRVWLDALALTMPTLVDWKHLAEKWLDYPDVYDLMANDPDLQEASANALSKLAAAGVDVAAIPASIGGTGIRGPILCAAARADLPLVVEELLAQGANPLSSVCLEDSVQSAADLAPDGSRTSAILQAARAKQAFSSISKPRTSRGR